MENKDLTTKSKLKVIWKECGHLIIAMIINTALAIYFGAVKQDFYFVLYFLILTYCFGLQLQAIVRDKEIANLKKSIHTHYELISSLHNSNGMIIELLQDIVDKNKPEKEGEDAECTSTQETSTTS